MRGSSIPEGVNVGLDLLQICGIMTGKISAVVKKREGEKNFLVHSGAVHIIVL